MIVPVTMPVSWEYPQEEKPAEGGKEITCLPHHGGIGVEVEVAVGARVAVGDGVGVEVEVVGGVAEAGRKMEGQSSDETFHHTEWKPFFHPSSRLVQAGRIKRTFIPSSRRSSFSLL